MSSSNLLTMANGSSSSSLNLQIPPISIKLDRDNYSLWRSTILSTLEIFNLESHVLKPDPPVATRIISTEGGEVTTEPNPAFTTWKQKDRFVLLWLRSTLTEHALALVVRATTAQLAWQTIDRSFQAQTRALRMHLKSQLQSLSKGSLPMIEYLDKKRAIVDSLADDQNPISDEDLIGYILTGLDPSYNAFSTAFMMKTRDVSVDELAGLLLHEEARQNHTTQQTGALLPTPTLPPPAVAYQVARKSNRNYNQRCSACPHQLDASSSSGRSSSPKPQLFCQLCRVPGHEALDC
ncbi:Retrovirus-related Pol polyprotein from transposon RE1 [Linum grandiflorum]